MTEPLTEADIEAWEHSLYFAGEGPNSHGVRLLATLRAEREARRKAEAQRDHAMTRLRQISKLRIDDSQFYRDVAHAALREIEGGENV